MKKPKITIQSIAENLNVSTATVSKVINGVAKKYRISDKTIKAVNDEIERLGYIPNTIAKSLRSQKSYTIGLIFPDLSNPWFTKLALQIEADCRKKGYHILLCNSNGSTKIENEHIQLLRNRMVDGIIIDPVGVDNDHLVNAYNEGLPMILIDRCFENSPIPFISSDDAKVSYEAVNYLIKKGHRKIVCLQGLDKTSSNIYRVSGYKRALEENGISFNPNLILGNDFTYENGYDNGLKIIENNDNNEENKITAIFSTSNQITLGVLKVFKEKNVKIPDDISIISFDDWDYSELLYTPITTISHILNSDAGSLAVKNLMKQIENDEKIKIPNTILSAKIIKRASVKTLL